MKNLFKFFICATVTLTGLQLKAGDAPTQPTLANCAASDTACKQNNQQLTIEYNTKLDAYNKQQAAAASAAAGSASAGFQDINNQADKGSSKYNKASGVAGIAGAGLMAAYAASYGTCGSCAAGAAIAFAVMGQAKSQAGRLDKAANSACQSANQTSSVQTSCGGYSPDTSNPYDPNSNSTLSQLNADGTCKATAPPDCQSKLNELANQAGTNIKDIGKGMSAFASGKGPKISADGIVTMPNGTTTTVDDLLTKEGMIKAGMSSLEADKLMAKLTGPGSALNPSKDLKELNKSSAPTEMSISGSGSGSATAGGGFDPAGKLGQKDLDKKRGPAGEGLTKNFNGDTIGAAGDDIFSMMNRRYKLKTAQDTFLLNIGK